MPRQQQTRKHDEIMLWLFIQCKKGRRTKEEKYVQSFSFVLSIHEIWDYCYDYVDLKKYSPLFPSFLLGRMFILLILLPIHTMKNSVSLQYKWKLVFYGFLFLGIILRQREKTLKKNENIYQWFAKIKWMRFPTGGDLTKIRKITEKYK